MHLNSSFAIRNSSILSFLIQSFYSMCIFFISSWTIMFQIILISAIFWFAGLEMAVPISRNTHIISPYQHGFLRRRSCFSNLLFFEEAVSRMTDEGQKGGVIYVDFAKAHTKFLLANMKFFGLVSLDGFCEFTPVENSRDIPTLPRLPCPFGINYSGCQSFPSLFAVMYGLFTTRVPPFSTHSTPQKRQ